MKFLSSISWLNIISKFVNTRTNFESRYTQNKNPKIFRFAIYYSGPRPTLFVADPEIMQMITNKYFDHFEKFGFILPEVESIDGNNFGLLNSSGEKWKQLRTNFQPAFNLANLKNYASNINAVSYKLYF